MTKRELSFIQSIEPCSLESDDSNAIIKYIQLSYEQDEVIILLFVKYPFLIVTTTSLPRFYLTKMIPFHCKRGSRVCNRCKALKDEGMKYCILKLYHDDDKIARPVVEMIIDSKKFAVPFEFYECYNTLDEAKSAEIEFVIDSKL